MKGRQDWMYVVLGSWVLVSPWILKLAGSNGLAAWCTALVGAALVTLAARIMLVPKAWQETTTAVLGFALLISPWVLDSTARTGTTASAAIVGALFVFLGTGSLGPDVIWVQRQRRRRRARSV